MQSDHNLVQKINSKAFQQLSTRGVVGSALSVVMLNTSRSLCVCCMQALHTDALAVAGTSRRAFSISRTVQRSKSGLDKTLAHIPPRADYNVVPQYTSTGSFSASSNVPEMFKQVTEQNQHPSGATNEPEGKSRITKAPGQPQTREQPQSNDTGSNPPYRPREPGGPNNRIDYGNLQERYRSRLTLSKKDAPPVYRPGFIPRSKPLSAYGEDRRSDLRSRGHDRRSSFGAGSILRKRSSEPQLSLHERLQARLPQWAKEPRSRARFELMGIDARHVRNLLGAFVAATPKTPDGWFPKNEDKKWQMQRVEWEARVEPQRALDGALTRRFLAWLFDESPAGAKVATKEATQVEMATTDSRAASRTPQSLVPIEQLEHARKIYNALDYTHPEEWFPVARLAQRTIHMHVGPTNSGKTYAALRALARAKNGVYASPLRMLAYEIFARLNAGKIAPDNVNAAEAENAPPGTYARPCNLLTGEEARVVDPYAGLLACTIEMFNHRARYDVAVVDEIQMISDPDRGGAWAAAVLGMNAREIHLCGEEGAVPLVQTMLRATGDEIIVHRYERLTPLQPAKTALNGRLKDIRKGDCVVAFARTSIFKLKEKIERETGLRCAVVYGRLPPEVRAEQAELFNDPDSGYDVLVGSDAIGMGLNL